MPALLIYTPTSRPRTPATQCKRHILHVGVPIIPFNGQTTSNHTKLSTPLRSPLDFSDHMPVDMSNGSSRRVVTGHQILPNITYAAPALCWSNAARRQRHDATQQTSRVFSRPTMTRRIGSSHPKHPLTNLTALNGHLLASRAAQRLVFPSKGTEKPLTD